MKKIVFAGSLLTLFVTSLSPLQAAALKKTIAVSEFENKTNLGGEWNLGTGMADMLTDALIQSGQFIVLERQGLDTVLAEQNLASSVRASKAGTGAQTGQIKKAQILIQGAVTEFEERKSGGGQGLSLFGVSVRNHSSAARVAVILRLIDSTTSQVIASRRVEGEATAGGLDYSANVGVVTFGQSAFQKTPLGKATQIAIDRAVHFVASQMAAAPWKGRVIKVEPDTIYINAGAQSGMSRGQVLRLSRPGESLVDPDTGLELGQELTVLGTVTAEEVFDRYSKAKPVFLSQPVQPGDYLEALR